MRVSIGPDLCSNSKFAKIISQQQELPLTDQEIDRCRINSGRYGAYILPDPLYIGPVKQSLLA